MSTTLDAALARIARKADIMRLDAARHSTARQDAEEIMALVQIAQRKVADLDAKLMRLNEQMDAIEEMGTESLNALPDCLMRLAPALVENDELKAKLAKAVDFVLRSIRYAGNSGDDFLADKARATLAELTEEK